MTAASAPWSAEARGLRDARRRLLDAATAVGIAERAVEGRTPWGLLSAAERRDAIRGAAWALTEATNEISRARRALSLVDDAEG